MVCSSVFSFWQNLLCIHTHTQKLKKKNLNKIKKLKKKKKLKLIYYFDVQETCYIPK